MGGACYCNELTLVVPFLRCPAESCISGWPATPHATCTSRTWRTLGWFCPWRSFKVRVLSFANLLHSGIRLIYLAGSVDPVACPAASSAQAMNQLFDLQLRSFVSCSTPFLPWLPGCSYRALCTWCVCDIYRRIMLGCVNLHSSYTLLPDLILWLPEHNKLIKAWKALTQP